MSIELPPLPEPARIVVYNKSKGYSAPMFTADQMRSYATGAVAAERERCAKVCEVYEYQYWRSTEDQDFTPQDCADAIRRENLEDPA